MAGKGNENIGSKLLKAGHAFALFFVLLLLILTGRIFAQDINNTMAWAPLLSAKLSKTLSQVSFSYSSHSEPAKTIDLHHFDISCSNCHQGQDPIEALRSNDPAKKLNVDINKSCAVSQCHNYSKNLNHPVGVTVNREIPDFMQLDGNSQITCLTCHDQKNSQSTDDTDRSAGRTLQVPRDTALCQSCHQTMDVNSGKSLHWQFSQKAHLGNINPNTTHDNQISSFSLHGDVDHESQTCVGCHDDITITTPALQESKGQKSLRYQRMSDHPIGMKYADIYTRDAGRYKAIHAASNDIRLFNGNVGCGSCHSLYSKKQNFLITENKNSKLCRKCHIG